MLSPDLFTDLVIRLGISSDAMNESLYASMVVEYVAAIVVGLFLENFFNYSATALFANFEIAFKHLFINLSSLFSIGIAAR